MRYLDHGCFLTINPTKEEIINMMAKAFTIAIQDIIVYNINEYEAIKSFSDFILICEIVPVKGDFKVLLEFWINDDKPLPSIDESEMFNIYRRLCGYFKCRLLVSDETVDTTRYLLFENPDNHYIVYLDSDSIDEGVFSLDCCEYPRYPQDMHDLPENTKKLVLEEYSAKNPFELISAGFWRGDEMLTAFKAIYFLCTKYSNTFIVEKLLERLKHAKDIDFRFKIFTLKYLRRIPEKYYADILEMAHELLKKTHNTDYKCDILDGLANYGNADSVKFIDELVLKISDKKFADKASITKSSILAIINK